LDSERKFVVGDGARPDPVTLRDQFQKDKTFEIIGGAYLGHLAGNTPSAANIMAYARIVREQSLLRQKATAHYFQRPWYELQTIEMELERLKNPQPLSFGKTGKDLMNKELKEIDWLVDGLIPARSRNSLVSKPKVGKTWLALEFALAIAAGGYALGKLKCRQGSVLYLALEDGETRLHRRLIKILESCQMSMPDAFYYETECPPVDKGGLINVVSWIEQTENPALVVIDTLKAFRPVDIPKGKGVYDVDYESTQALMPYVEKYGTAILWPHHANKRSSNDPIDLISGSFGLAGGLDNNLVITKEYGKNLAKLHRIGRDYVDDAPITIQFSRETALWTAVDEEVAISDERQEILELMRDGYGSAKEIAEVLGKSPQAISRLLYKMVKLGLVEKAGYGKYKLSSTSDTSGISGTTDTSDTTALKPDIYRWSTPPVDTTSIDTARIGTTAGTSYNSFYNNGLSGDYVKVVSVVSH
jgi:DNA-binding transcriptional ArsR family regulator